MCLFISAILNRKILRFWSQKFIVYLLQRGNARRRCGGSEKI